METNIIMMTPLSPFKFLWKHIITIISNNLIIYLLSSVSWEFLKEIINCTIHFQPELGSTEKPTEIFHIMEHFCLGRRRLHLFAVDDTLRPGNISIIFFQYLY